MHRRSAKKTRRGRTVGAHHTFRIILRVGRCKGIASRHFSPPILFVDRGGGASESRLLSFFVTFGSGHFRFTLSSRDRIPINQSICGARFYCVAQRHTMGYVWETLTLSLFHQSVFDNLEGEEMRRARTRSNAYETIRGAFFLNRSAPGSPSSFKAKVKLIEWIQCDVSGSRLR